MWIFAVHYYAIKKAKVLFCVIIKTMKNKRYDYVIPFLYLRQLLRYILNIHVGI